MEIQHIEAELKGYQAFLEEYDEDKSLAVLDENLVTCTKIIARTGKIVADLATECRRVKKEQILTIVADIAKEGYLSASIQKTLVDSCVVEEQMLHDWAESVNKTATKLANAMVTRISAQKEEMKLLKFNEF